VGENVANYSGIAAAELCSARAADPLGSRRAGVTLARGAVASDAIVAPPRQRSPA
jgi:hypothetical protein